MSTPKEIDGIEVVEDVPDAPWWWERCYELHGKRRWALKNAESDAEGRVLHALTVIWDYGDEWFGTPVDEVPIMRLIANAPAWQAKAIEQQARIKALEAENASLRREIGVLRHYMNRDIEAQADEALERQHGAEATRDA